MDELSKTQQRLYDLLREVYPHSLSRKKLAKTMNGISNEALRAQISRMRDKGVEIETLTITYYRLGNDRRQIRASNTDGDWNINRRLT